MTPAQQKAEALAMYQKYVAAEEAVLRGQSYSIGDRSLTRANIAEIQRGRREWAIKAGMTRRRPRFHIPRDI